MQQASLINIRNLQHHISVSSTTSCRHDILVEREGNEHDDSEEVDGGADGAHALWDLGLAELAHVAAFEAGLHEGGAEPADHGEAETEGAHGECEGGEEGFAIVAEVLDEDGGRGA